MVLDMNVRERQVNGMKTLQLEMLGASAIQCFDKVLLTMVGIFVDCFCGLNIQQLFGVRRLVGSSE